MPYSGFLRLGFFRGTNSANSSTWSSSSNDSWRHVGDDVLVQGEGLGDGEAPPSLEGPSHHRPRGRGRCRGQAEWVRKPWKKKGLKTLKVIYYNGAPSVVDGVTGSRREAATFSKLQNKFYQSKQECPRGNGVMDSTLACYAGGWGSIPAVGS